MNPIQGSIIEVHNVGLGNEDDFLFFTNQNNDDQNKITNNSSNSIKVEVIKLERLTKSLEKMIF